MLRCLEEKEEEEVGGSGRSLVAVAALSLAVPGSLVAEAGEIGRERKRTSGVLRVGEEAVIVTVVVVVVSLPGVHHLHQERVVEVPGGSRGKMKDQRDLTGHHQDVRSDKDPGDKAVGEGETLVIEDHLRQGTLVATMIVDPGDPQDALLIVMFGDVVEVRIVLLPEVEDVIVTLVIEDLLQPDVTIQGQETGQEMDHEMDHEMMDLVTGVVVEIADPSPEMIDPEIDRPLSMMTAGLKSTSVNPAVLITLLGRISQICLKVLPNLHQLELSVSDARLVKQDSDWLLE